jgi:hypothetical protein
MLCGTYTLIGVIRYSSISATTAMLKMGPLLWISHRLILGVVQSIAMERGLAASGFGRAECLRLGVSIVAVLVLLVLGILLGARHLSSYWCESVKVQN